MATPITSLNEAFFYRANRLLNSFNSDRPAARAGAPMRRMKLLTVALLSAAMCMPAQNDVHKQIHTGDKTNGRFWNSLKPWEKTCYLTGFADAINQIRVIESMATAPNFFPYGQRSDEIIKAVDRFYDAPENMRISIADTLGICRARFAGRPEADVQELILMLRRHPIPFEVDGK